MVTDTHQGIEIALELISRNHYWKGTQIYLIDIDKLQIEIQVLQLWENTGVKLQITAHWNQMRWDEILSALCEIIDVSRLFNVVEASNGILKVKLSVLSTH